MKVEKGSTVKLNYTGKYEDGEVFDSSLNEGREPLYTTLGQGNLISGFEQGIVGMGVNETRTIEIEPEDGYGEYLDGLVTTVSSLVTTVSRDKIPEEAKVGDVLQSQSERGVMNVTVKEINENEVVLDANHPMAGKKLVFEIEMLEIG
jgi:FKBP-type peptidyl-prolyl cis-trans isomerase 2